MLRVPPRRIAGRPGYWSWLRVVLVVVAVAHRRLGPSSSATTSTTERALPSSAVQVRCWSRPTTTTRLPFDSDSAACSACSHHTTTVRTTPPAPYGPTPPPGTWPERCHPRCSGPRGSSVRLPSKLTAASVMVHPSCCLAGRSALHLEPGDGGYRGMPQGRLGQAVEPTKSARLDNCRPWLAQEPGWLVGACGWGSGMPAPSGQIPPPWAWRENEAPTTRADHRLRSRRSDRSGIEKRRRPSRT
jgi:hypothetical protein